MYHSIYDYYGMELSTAKGCADTGIVSPGGWNPLVEVDLLHLDLLNCNFGGMRSTFFSSL